MQSNPLISVLMTAYNREKYIAEAIESVLASTYTNFELIIVDDCSVDNSVAIAKAFETKDSRIKVYVNERNLSDYYNRNKAASYATGKYIKYLDSDDIIFPWGLQAMAYCMEYNPQAALGLTLNNFKNEKFPIIVFPEKVYKLYYFKNLLLNVGPTGAIIRRDVFEDLNGFSGKRYIGDTELWLRIAQKNPLVWMPANLIFWREHDEQQIVLERRDHIIEAIRHELNIQFLKSEDCPLSKEDALIAIRNLKNIKCRNIMKEFLRGKIGVSIRNKMSLDLKTIDFLRSLKKNKLPRI